MRTQSSLCALESNGRSEEWKFLGKSILSYSHPLSSSNCGTRWHREEEVEKVNERRRGISCDGVISISRTESPASFTTAELSLWWGLIVGERLLLLLLCSKGKTECRVTCVRVPSKSIIPLDIETTVSSVKLGDENWKVILINYFIVRENEEAEEEVKEEDARWAIYTYPME